MQTERVTAATTIEAGREAVFAVLADTSAHADIDATGWVHGSLDGDRITAAGQVFRIAMYHENHPHKRYPRLLHRVLCLGERSEHAIGHRLQPRPVGFELGGEILVHLITLTRRAPRM
jgi:hypothetical protein